MLHSLTGSRGGLQGEYLIWTWCLSQSPPTHPPFLFFHFSCLHFSSANSSPSKWKKNLCRCEANSNPLLSTHKLNVAPLLQPMSKMYSLTFFFLHLWMDVVLWYLYCVQCCISVFMTRGATGGKTWSLDLSLWRIDDGCHYSWVPIVTFWMTECLKWKSEDCESENVNLMFLPQKKVDVGFLFLCV